MFSCHFTCISGFWLFNVRLNVAPDHWLTIAVQLSLIEIVQADENLEPEGNTYIVCHSGWLDISLLLNPVWSLIYLQ